MVGWRFAHQGIAVVLDQLVKGTGPGEKQSSPCQGVCQREQTRLFSRCQEPADPHRDQHEGAKRGRTSST